MRGGLCREAAVVRVVLAHLGVVWITRTAPNRAETFPPRKRVIFHDGRAIFLELVDLRGAVLHVLADLKR